MGGVLLEATVGNDVTLSGDQMGLNLGIKAEVDIGTEVARSSQSSGLGRTGVGNLASIGIGLLTRLRTTHVVFLRYLKYPFVFGIFGVTASCLNLKMGGTEALENVVAVLGDFRLATDIILPVSALCALFLGLVP